MQNYTDKPKKFMQNVTKRKESKMYKPRIIAAAAATALLTSALALFVQGDELIYDSQSDPLVSLSYINEVVIAEYDKKLAEINDKISVLTKKNTELETEKSTLQASLVIANAKLTELEKQLEELKNAPDGSQFEVICLQKGQKLLATSPCELILRSGAAIVVSITTNGVNDMTDGTELMNAAAAPLYHSLLVPRGNDGRGIQVTSNEAYIMVRGGYQIVD